VNKDQLQQIIDQIENEDLKSEAYLGIFEYGGGPDESYIKANKQGLQLFALELLKAARDSDDLLNNENEQSIFTLGFDEIWVDDESTTFIQYVEPTKEIRERVKSEPYKETWQDKVARFGCIIAILLAVLSGIVGAVTMIKWIF